MSKVILAIDPSLTNTAVVIGDGETISVKCFGSKACGDNPVLRIVRAANLVREICEHVVKDIPFAGVYIEGYSFGSNDSRARFSAEYGGLLREMLMSKCSLNLREVAPTTLKKFCTGKGAGKKEMVIGHLMKRYGCEFATNDEFDAYGLYRLGLVAEGIEEAQNQAQREAADKVLGIVAPKKSKKAS
jgi:Holliday junction resolvasome RuvABC endonuclease subunit